MKPPPELGTELWVQIKMCSGNGRRKDKELEMKASDSQPSLLILCRFVSWWFSACMWLRVYYLQFFYSYQYHSELWTIRTLTQGLSDGVLWGQAPGRDAWVLWAVRWDLYGLNLFWKSNGCWIHLENLEALGSLSLSSGHYLAVSAVWCRCHTCSTTVFGCVLCIKWYPHEWQFSRFPGRALQLYETYFSLHLLVLLMLWLTGTYETGNRNLKPVTLTCQSTLGS